MSFTHVHQNNGHKTLTHPKMNTRVLGHVVVTLRGFKWTRHSSTVGDINKKINEDGFFCRRREGGTTVKFAEFLSEKTKKDG